MIVLTEQEREAVHEFAGSSSQMLALLLMQQREAEASHQRTSIGWKPDLYHHNALARVNIFNEMLMAVRDERGR